jgi:Sigma-70, region 4
MLGYGEAADAAQRAGRDAAQGDRLRALAAAATACREQLPAGETGGLHEPAATGEAADETGDAGSLAEAVAREVARATAQLPERQREALALRELLVLPYDEIGPVVGLDSSAVGLLLARARLRFRVALRGEGVPMPSCDERERALRTIAHRQDGEPVTDADEDWLIEHLGHCVGCARAHSTMLEASACYRAWRFDEAEASPVGADTPS